MDIQKLSKDEAVKAFHTNLLELINIFKEILTEYTEKQELKKICGLLYTAKDTIGNEGVVLEAFDALYKYKDAILAQNEAFLDTVTITGTGGVVVLLSAAKKYAKTLEKDEMDHIKKTLIKLLMLTIQTKKLC